MSLQQGGRGVTNTRRPVFHRVGRAAALAVLMFVGVALSGCLEGDGLDWLEEGGEGVGFVQVEVSLRSFGEYEGNVSWVDLSFSKVSIYEKTTKQWVHVRPDSRLVVGLDGEEEQMARLTLPMGRYTELRVHLEGAELGVEGEIVQARVLKTVCQAPITLDLTSKDHPDRLTLFFRAGDLLTYSEGEWFVAPAFSGSFARDAAAAGENGTSRLGEPHCMEGEQDA